MAKKFAGFKREAMEKKILPALGYTGSMDQKSINNFLAANPNAAATNNTCFFMINSPP